MASMLEELVTILRQEEEIYQSLIPISQEKTKVLVQGDLKGLQDVTDREQELLDRANGLDKHRQDVIKNIGVVLNRDPKDLDLATLSRLMASQPEERKKISQVHDDLKRVMKQLVQINQKNKTLIEHSLEMVEFNMNFIQSTRMSPGSNNYDKHASETGYRPDFGAGRFDAKQ